MFVTYTTARADKAVNIIPSVTLVPSLSLADDGPVPVPKDSFFVVSSQHVAPSSLLVQGSALQFVSIGIPLSSLIKPLVIGKFFCIANFTPLERTRFVVYSIKNKIQIMQLVHVIFVRYMYFRRTLPSGPFFCFLHVRP